MRVTLILADTGRQTPSGISLLQVGWKATFAIPRGDGSFTLPEQAVVVYIEAEFGEVNRVYDTHLRLVSSSDEEIQHFNQPQGIVNAEVRSQVLIPQVLGATAGSDSCATLLFPFPAGTIRVGGGPTAYKWICRVGSDEGHTEFWVNSPPTAPSVGGSPGAGT
jgi:hypothetical protein